MSSAAPEISVVFPVYGSREVLPRLYRRTREVLEDEASSWEILFVEDACPEGSIESLEALASRDDRVIVLALERRVGQHEAVRVGLLEARGAIVVVMDADLQDPPEAIPDLVRLVRSGSPVVFAGRRGAYESRGRLMTSRLFKSVLARVARTPRDAGMYVAMDRRALDAVLLSERRGFYLVAAIGLSGLPARSVPVRRRADPTGRSGYRRLHRLGMAVWLLAWACLRRIGIGRRAPRPPAPAVGFRRIGRGTPTGSPCVDRHRVPADSP